MRVLVCGGRNYADKIKLWKNLDFIHNETPITRIIHGGASGADSLAYGWACARVIKCEVYYADWKQYGPSAGPIRNKKMIETKPDLVVCFPGGKGTRNMRMLAENAGVRINLIL